MADTFSPNTVAPPPGISSPLTAQVLQHTLHALHTLLAEPPHSRAGSWCQQRQRALLWRNRQRACNCWPVSAPMAALICCMGRWA